MAANKKSVLGGAAAILAFIFFAVGPITTQAQGTENASALEEIYVTGRKREENLINVPVSVSVWSSETMLEQGIVGQQELFDSTPGLAFDTNKGDRNSANPSIRGVSAASFSSNTQKVNSFIDGMPITGWIGSLTFSGIDQVEIYRGPQSAAFGRATFAGAINYVTADAADEFEAKVQAGISDLGRNELGVAISGPLGDKLGYRLSYIVDEFEGPDNWTSTDGYSLGSEETKTFNGKLNFEFTDTIYGEVMYSRVEQNDMVAPTRLIDPATCPGGSGIFLFSMGSRVELPTGKWDCDIPDGLTPRNFNALGQFSSNYDANIAAYTAAAPRADANGDGLVQLNEYLGQTLRDGSTYEQALLGQTVDPFVVTERDRFQGELNVEIGDNLLKFMGMYADETSQRWEDSDFQESFPVFATNMFMQTALNSNTQGMSNPTSIEEKYFEARWVSPGDQKLRYNLSGSYYEVDAQTNGYFNWGAQAYNLRLPNGQPIDPQRRLILQSSASAYGLAFGLQYDLSDRTTLSFEGRYQQDENCGEDFKTGIKNCVDTTSFAPRIAINSAISENHSVYGQISRGTNPAGINIGMSLASFETALNVASGKIASPFDGFTYDGSDGVHLPAVGYDADTYRAHDEETLTNFEIGSKGSYSDGRGSYALALYYMIWEDQLITPALDWNDTSPNGWNSGNYTSSTFLRTNLNSGDSDFYGIEFDTSYALSDVWTIGGNLTLSRSEFSSYCSPFGPDYTVAGGGNPLPILRPGTDDVVAPCSVVDGNSAPKASDIKGALNISATLPNDLMGMRTSFRADMYHTGPYFVDDLNLIERKAVTTMNLSANMRNDNLTLRFFINNVTNEDEPTNNLQFFNYYSDNANPTRRPGQVGAFAVYPRRPREFGITAIYDF